MDWVLYRENFRTKKHGENPDLFLPPVCQHWASLLMGREPHLFNVNHCNVNYLFDHKVKGSFVLRLGSKGARL